MIAYDLQCSNGHRFEGWFEDSKAFDRQNAQGVIACPVCEDIGISKIPSTFSIKGSSGTMLRKPDADRDLAALSRQIVDYVEKNFDNVGSDFAVEALKMHYGVTEPRNIRGSSTPQEEKTLRDEGIKFLKFPVPTKPSDSSDSEMS